MNNDLMDEKGFWSIIEKGKNSDDVLDIVREELRKLSLRNIVMFNIYVIAFLNRTYGFWFMSAFLIIDDCGDDGFKYLRCGLIARGEEIYKKAVENPDSLADLDTKVEENEAFSYLAYEVYEEITGEEYTGKEVPMYELSAELCEDVIPKIYPLFFKLPFSNERNMQFLPKLMKKYGSKK